MRSMNRYKPVVTDTTIQTVDLFDAEGESLTEIVCEMDGFVYLSVNPDADISSIDDALEFEQAELTDSLVKQIKAASAACQLIENRKDQALLQAQDELSRAAAITAANDALTEMGFPQLSSYEETMAQAGFFANERKVRGGMVAAVQQKAKSAGMGSQMRDILSYASEAIAEWKNDGNLTDLEHNLSELGGVKIRAALDKTLPTGVTIQTYLLTALGK